MAKSRRPTARFTTAGLRSCKAIASAGGFTDFANKKKVRLTRVDGRTQIVNCVKALENPSLDLEVYPGRQESMSRASSGNGPA